VIVDEMDLVSQLKDAAPLRPEAYERARTTLRAAMAEPEPARVPEMVPVPPAAPLRGRGLSRPSNRRRGALGARGKVGIGAGIGAVAAGVAVALAATSAPQPAAPARAASAARKAPAVGSSLVSLAAFIMAGDGSLPGDASLIIRHQPTPAGPMEITYNLYTDSGAYYVVDAAGEGGRYAAAARKALTAAVAGHANLAYGSGGIREVAAARYAATGDLAAAREQMNNAMRNNDYYDSLAQRKAIWARGAAARAKIEREKGIRVPLTMPTGKRLQEDIDSTIWGNSFDALSQGAGSPQVRAGVLRLLSTVPEVTVANSRTDGKPTLTLTAVFGVGDSEVLTINARTGMPVSFASRLTGVKPVLDTFQVSRVTLAAVEAGRF
jgi:hypothetical protein